MNARIWDWLGAAIVIALMAPTVVVESVHGVSSKVHEWWVGP